MQAQVLGKHVNLLLDTQASVEVGFLISNEIAKLAQL